MPDGQQVREWTCRPRNLSLSMIFAARSTGIDDRLLKLVAERLALVDQVRAAKRGKDGHAPDAAGARGCGPQAPHRDRRQPGARRALLSALARPDLRRHATAVGNAHPRLDRPLHIGECASPDPAIFSASPLVGHPGETGALQALVGNPNDIAAVAIDAPWVEPYLEGLAGKAQIIGCLPFIAPEAMPRILIFGHAAPEPTGADETLVITDGQLPRDFVPAPLWQMRVGTKRLTSLPGFLSEHSMPLLGLVRSNSKLALTVLGRYPSPIEMNHELRQPPGPAPAEAGDTRHFSLCSGKERSGRQGLQALPEPLLVPTTQAKRPESGGIGGQLIGDRQLRRKALLPEQLAHQPLGCPLVPARLDQDIEDLALLIDSPPQIHAPAGDPHDHLIQMPAITRPGAPLPQTVARAAARISASSAGPTS